MREQVRSYIKMVNEFINVQSPFDCEILGTIIYNNIGYPFISFHTHSKLAKYNVVINSGAHGTEMISVRTMLRFLQEFNQALLGYYNFLLFPILNPYGYTYDIRKNGNKQYANSGFTQPEDKLTPEAILIRDIISHKVDLFIDIHADKRSGFYIYERKRPDKKSLAEESLKVLRKSGIAVLEADTIYNEKCVNGVVVQPIKDGSMDDSMFQRGAIYSLCIEIPSRMPEDQQIIGCLLLINEILTRFREIN